MKKLITISILTSSMLMALDMPTPKESYKADFAVNGINFKADVSKNNTLGFSELTCENGSAGVSIKASTTRTKEVLTFNSCTGNYVVTKPPANALEMSENLADTYFDFLANSTNTAYINGDGIVELGNSSFLYNSLSCSTLDENGNVVSTSGVVMRDVDGDGKNDYTYITNGQSFSVDTANRVNFGTGLEVKLPDEFQDFEMVSGESIYFDYQHNKLDVISDDLLKTGNIASSSDGSKMDFRYNYETYKYDDKGVKVNSTATGDELTDSQNQDSFVTFGF